MSITAECDDIVMIDLRDPSHYTLAKLNVFYDFMKPFFPMESEMDPISVWIEGLEPNPNRSSTVSFHALVALSSVDPDTINADPSAPAVPPRPTPFSLPSDPLTPAYIVGGTVFEFYALSNCSLISYLAVHATARRKKLGDRLTSAACNRVAELSRSLRPPTPPPLPAGATAFQKAVHFLRGHSRVEALVASWAGEGEAAAAVAAVAAAAAAVNCAERKAAGDACANACDSSSSCSSSATSCCGGPPYDLATMALLLSHDDVAELEAFRWADTTAAGGVGMLFAASAAAVDTLETAPLPPVWLDGEVHAALPVLCETNAADVSDGIMDSTARHGILSRLGYAHVPFDYTQPPLEEGMDPCYDLLFAAQTKEGLLPRVAAVGGAVTDDDVAAAAAADATGDVPRGVDVPPPGYLALPRVILRLFMLEFAYTCLLSFRFAGSAAAAQHNGQSLGGATGSLAAALPLASALSDSALAAWQRAVAAGDVSTRACCAQDEVKACAADDGSDSSLSCSNADHADDGDAGEDVAPAGWWVVLDAALRDAARMMVPRRLAPWPARHRREERSTGLVHAEGAGTADNVSAPLDARD